MSDYTPTTEVVRDNYGWTGHDSHLPANREFSKAAFDRWLAEHDREAMTAVVTALESAEREVRRLESLPTPPAPPAAGQPEREALVRVLVRMNFLSEISAEPWTMEQGAEYLLAAGYRREPEPREVTTQRTFEELMTDDPIRYTARRDSEGCIRLSFGKGALVANASDTRRNVQEWFDRAGAPKWAAMYRAALNLIDSEAAVTPSTEETP